jgi:hypothetical protein
MFHREVARARFDAGHGLGRISRHDASANFCAWSRIVAPTQALVSEFRVIVPSTANPRRMPQEPKVVLMRMLFPRDCGAQKARNRHHPHEN